MRVRVPQGAFASLATVRLRKLGARTDFGLGPAGGQQAEFRHCDDGCSPRRVLTQAVLSAQPYVLVYEL